MDLTAVPKSIDDTLRLNRKYVIPRFQREFSWETEELSEIYNDLLENLSYNGKELLTSDYFIGSLVLVGDDDDTSNVNRLVVDGQQRLMVFTIAFSVLAQKFKEIGEDRLSDKIHLNVMGEDNDGNSYAKLVNESPKPFFQKRIQQRSIDFTAVPSTPEEKRILFAYNFFDKQLKEKVLIKNIKDNIDNLGEIKYIDALKAFRDQLLKCKVIYVTVKSLEDAYTIFEVLNAKGKDLTPVDMIKNSIFSILVDEEPYDAAADTWRKIKNELYRCDNVDINTFYRHFWLSKYSLSTNRKLVNNFDKRINKTIAEYSEFLRDLCDNAKRYANIVSPKQDFWRQPEDLFVLTALESFNIFNVTQVRVFLLALFDVKDSSKISHKNFKKILLFLEHYHFIFTAICSCRPSGLERKYSNYARELRKCNTKEETATVINDLINDLKESLPEYESFKNSFSKVIYTSEQPKDKKLVQYILKKIEIFYSNNELKPNSFSIEHILSESTRNSKIGMIGNLLPLGEQLNSIINDRVYRLKIEKYKESRYATVIKFIEMYGEQPDWCENDIISRTELIADILYNNMVEG